MVTAVTVVVCRTCSRAMHRAGLSEPWRCPLHGEGDEDTPPFDGTYPADPGRDRVADFREKPGRATATEPTP